MVSEVSPTAAWYAVGFLGQLVFGSRFFIQWIVSERARRVIIPKPLRAAL